MSVFRALLRPRSMVPRICTVPGVVEGVAIGGLRDVP